ncbi:L2 protein [Equus asinus papillomavirus 2]|uniref:Minor capsid protein L2 n=1 Tax=Equus asinus papillomavirus 2 TaxID=2547428 RepID=A0A482EWG9_9PAPI|nr:L2 protein [Equus asinus papillomavirus 2]
MSASHGVLSLPRRVRVRRGVRVPRASVQDLYPSCRTGDCPPDVKNKVEGTTLADRLLQWLSSFIYLGNLGIGTGRGGGGRLGYSPLPHPGGPEGGVRVVRPSVTVDPLGASDVIPLETLGPDAPSIVPLSEVGEGDLPSLGGGAGGTGSPGTELTSGGAPVLDTSHTWVPPGSEGGFTATYPNPTFDGDVISGPSNTSPVVRGDVFVTGDVSVSLDSASFDLTPGTDGGPLSSTPDPSVRTGRTRGGLTGRAFEQIELQDLGAFGMGGGGVSTFENPAFNSGSLLLDSGFEGDPPFQDLRRLGSVQTFKSARGVSLSRVGRRETLTTRSGRTIGGNVHYFHILSSIAPEESLGVGPISGTPGVDGFEEISLSSFPSLVSDSELLDEEVVDISGHLVIGSGRDSRLIPQRVQRPPLATFDPVTGWAAFSEYTSGSHGLPHSLIPGVVVYVDVPDGSGTFDLHPSMLPRKRKHTYY